MRGEAGGAGKGEKKNTKLRRAASGHVHVEVEKFFSYCALASAPSRPQHTPRLIVPSRPTTFRDLIITVLTPTHVHTCKVCVLLSLLSFLTIFFSRSPPARAPSVVPHAWPFPCLRLFSLHPRLRPPHACPHLTTAPRLRMGPWLCPHPRLPACACISRCSCPCLWHRLAISIRRGHERRGNEDMDTNSMPMQTWT